MFINEKLKRKTNRLVELKFWLISAIVADAIFIIKSKGDF